MMLRAQSIWGNIIFVRATGEVRGGYTVILPDGSLQPGEVLHHGEYYTLVRVRV